MALHSHHTGHLIITFNHQTHTSGLFTGVVTVHYLSFHFFFPNKDTCISSTLFYLSALTF